MTRQSGRKKMNRCSELVGRWEGQPDAHEAAIKAKQDDMDRSSQPINSDAIRFTSSSNDFRHVLLH